MGTEHHREAALSKLLTEIFDGDSAGLLRWVRSHLGKRIHDELPTGAPLSQLAFDAALAIQRHGLTRQAFVSLSDERSGQAGRIEEVALLWGVTSDAGVMREPVIPGGTPTARQATIDAVLHTLPHGLIPEPTPLPPVSRIPIARNSLFVGREEELRKLAEALQVERTAAIGQMAAVTGLGGIGKTQLAAEFAHRYGQFFRGGVFWLSFTNGESVPAEFAQCGGPEHLGMWTMEGAPDIGTQVAMVCKLFAEPVPRLLIFDNCEDEKLLDEWRPKSGGCRILVTCRRYAFSPHLGVHTLALDVLPRAESLTLLRSLSRGQPFDPAYDAVLNEICAELGDLPLALHLAGSFLTRYRNVVTPAAYLAQLRDQALLGHKSLQGYGAQNSPTGHDLHVGRTFALSWDRLDPTDPVDVIGRSLLQHAACLAPGEPIPHVLLVASIGLPQDEADAMLIVQDALHRLLSLGLLDALESDVYTIHRLVTAFVQQVGGDSERARIAIEQILLTTAQHVNHSGNPARLLPLQSHLRAITDAARKREDVLAARLCNELSYHLQEVGDYRNARRYCEQALIIFEKRLGQEHLFTARCLNDLAEILRNEGAYDEARPLYERALTICEKQGGPDHPLTTTTSNNLALLLFAQQNYPEARPLLEHALVRSEKQLGSDDPDIVTSLNNLAELLRAQEDYAGARPLFERALAICEEHFEPDHPDTARALNNLANLLLDQKDYAEARLLYERALGIWERQRVPDHPNMARSLNNLATLLHTQGAYTEARPLYERALVICEFRLGPDHPFSQLVRDNLQSLPES